MPAVKDTILVLPMVARPLTVTLLLTLFVFVAVVSKIIILSPVELVPKSTSPVITYVPSSDIVIVSTVVNELFVTFTVFALPGKMVPISPKASFHALRRNAEPIRI